MQNKKNQSNVGQMIQRCHKWRQKRKQYIDQARQTADEIERERLLQTAEHYGRMVNTEQGKIDSTRDPKEKAAAIAADEEAQAIKLIQIWVSLIAWLLMQVAKRNDVWKEKACRHAAGAGVHLSGGRLPTEK